MKFAIKEKREKVVSILSYFVSDGEGSPFQKLSFLSFTRFNLTGFGGISGHWGSSEITPVGLSCPVENATF
jgi:hypothetical protein